MKNPLNGEPMSQAAVDYIEQIREARRKARKAARSGNPAIRFPARRVLRDAPRLIAATYVRDAA